MKAVYEAADLLEAHMLRGLLEQHRIHAFIQGESLVGGAGEIPVIGLVRVLVHEEDEVAARAIIETWEERQPDFSEPEPGAVRQGSQWHWLAAGIVIGVILTLLARANG